MVESRGMSRRLTGSEEARLIEVSRRVDAEIGKLQAERDLAILEAIDAGARITDIASVLGMSRSAVYDARDRAREQAGKFASPRPQAP